MTPWLRATLWIVFWATLLVSLLVGAFVAWLATRGRSGVSTDRRGLIVAPVVSPARKAVVVRYAWR